MDPPATPSLISAIVSAVASYGPVSACLAALGFVWHGSKKVTVVEQTQLAHGERLKEHHIDIAALKASDAATRVIVAGLPSQQDVRDLRDEMRDRDARIQAQIQGGFDTVTRLLGRRD